MKKNNQPEQPWYTDGDGWSLEQKEWDSAKNIYFETIFTQANGYFGFRGYTEESTPGTDSQREGYLAGVFGEIDKAAYKQIRVDYKWPMLCMITLPEIFSCQITLKGDPFNLHEGTISSFRRTLNMRNGELSRELVWISPSGLRTRLLFKRFLSAAIPHLAMQKVKITPENWSGKAEITFTQDAGIQTLFRCGDRAMPHLPQKLTRLQKVYPKTGSVGLLGFQTNGTGHSVSIASAVENGESVKSTPGILKQATILELEKDISSSVLHAVAVVSSRDVDDPSQISGLAEDTAMDALRLGYQSAFEESESVWDHRWATSDITIEGPKRDQAYIRYGTFSLLQMAPFHTDSISIPARGYALNRYHGLYYWDSEIFLMPQYLHTHPDVAENLLSFRHHTLDGARKNAAYLKAKGACFPWMTDSDDGNEQGPWKIGDYLWHQTADIAYAIDQYVRATGDTSFMLEKGLEMIIEGARFWVSKLKKGDKGAFHLHNTVGPDELDNHGKDNGYVSLLAQHHLRLAISWTQATRIQSPAETGKLLKKLGVTDREISIWKNAEDRMVIPKVPRTEIPLQDEFLFAKKPMKFDGLGAEEAYAKRHTHRVVKQADIILAMFLLQEDFTTEQLRDAYDFYEPMTLHYSSLSYNTHAILAVRIGREQQAYDYFMKAAGLDLDDLRGATVDGLHAAALGGTWQTIVYGFLGMRLQSASLLRLSTHLPKAWKAVSLQLMYRGYKLKIHATHKECSVEVDGSENSGQAFLILNGEKHDLRDDLTIVAPTQKQKSTTPKKK